MATAFTPTPTNILLPNMRATIAGTAMGLTVGGVEVTHNPEWHKVGSDQYGGMNVQGFHIGDEVSVKFGLAEFSYANLAKALGPTSTLRSSGGTAVGVGGLYAGAKIATAVGVALIFHPLDEDDSSLVDDINVWEAILRCDPIQFGGKGKGELVLNVTADVYADTSKTQGKMLIDFGLAAAT